MVNFASLSNFLIGYNFGLFNTLGDHLQYVYGWTDSEKTLNLTLVNSLPQGVAAIVCLFIGGLSASYGRRKMLIFTAIAALFGCTITLINNTTALILGNNNTSYLIYIHLHPFRPYDCWHWIRWLVGNRSNVHNRVSTKSFQRTCRDSILCPLRFRYSLIFCIGLRSAWRSKRQFKQWILAINDGTADSLSCVYSSNVLTCLQIWDSYVYNDKT